MQISFQTKALRKKRAKSGLTFWVAIWRRSSQRKKIVSYIQSWISACPAFFRVFTLFFFWDFFYVFEKSASHQVFGQLISYFETLSWKWKSVVYSSCSLSKIQHVLGRNYALLNLLKESTSTRMFNFVDHWRVKCLLGCLKRSFIEREKRNSRIKRAFWSSTGPDFRHSRLKGV